MKKILSPVIVMIAVMLMLSSAAASEQTASETQTAESETSATVTGTESTTGQTAAVTPASPVKIVKKGSKSYLYRTSDNKPVTGCKGITQYPAGSGKYYYFISKTTGRIKVGAFKKKGLRYYAKEDGTLARGWVTLQKRTYYFKKDFTCASGMVKIGKNKYYFSENAADFGVQKKGFVRVYNTQKTASYYRYFNPNKNGAMATGLTKISNRYYYFTKKYGRMKTGLVKINGKAYFFNEKGIRCTGLKTWKGKTYFFSKKAGYTCISGWKKRKGIKYYFSNNSKTFGQAVTGWMTLKGKYYYFNESGEMQTGWQTINNKKYYFDPTSGAMATGEKTIDNKKYTFGKDGVYKDPIETATGAWSIRVNLSTNITTVYRGTTAVKAMYCSPGAATAKYVGTTTIRDKLRWHELMGPSWGQYCEHLYDSILFHSIPYQRAYDPSSMPFSAFNQLGQAVSHGCIRLACIDAYYIYTNCPVGTSVTINYWSSDPLTPTRYWASGSGLGYDPTDPVYS